MAEQISDFEREASETIGQINRIVGQVDWRTGRCGPTSIADAQMARIRALGNTADEIIAGIRARREQDAIWSRAAQQSRAPRPSADARVFDLAAERLSRRGGGSASS